MIVMDWLRRDEQVHGKTIIEIVGTDNRVKRSR